MKLWACVWPIFICGFGTEKSLMSTEPIFPVTSRWDAHLVVLKLVSRIPTFSATGCSRRILTECYRFIAPVFEKGFVLFLFKTVNLISSALSVLCAGWQLLRRKWWKVVLNQSGVSLLIFLSKSMPTLDAPETLCAIVSHLCRVA